MTQPWAPHPGLCAGCENVKIIDTRKGSRFYLCQLAEVDPRFPRYPRIPVLRCHGYREAAVPVEAESEA
ncbi:MAG TPA: hypothetical protein VF665_04415 [Longimicrobium sp.]|jgi:hypothetical protein|uniref:hypothetical protein n=1 Tax=Longimicrobium sp. TaxID=2029185 RepID=UPI002EDA03FB